MSMHHHSNIALYQALNKNMQTLIYFGMIVNVFLEEEIKHCY